MECLARSHEYRSSAGGVVDEPHGSLFAALPVTVASRLTGLTSSRPGPTSSHSPMPASLDSEMTM
jgi:hypothetical protein